MRYFHLTCSNNCKIIQNTTTFSNSERKNYAWIYQYALSDFFCALKFDSKLLECYNYSALPYKSILI